MAEPQTAKRVEDILIGQNLITSKQVEELKVEAAKVGRPVEDLIAEKNLVDSEKLAEARAQVLGIPYSSLVGVEISAEILNLIPQNTAVRYILIPFEKTDSALRVAMYDPLDLQVISFLERRIGLKVEPHLATVESIRSKIETQYKKTLGEEVVAALEEAGVGTALEIEEAKDIEREPETIRRSPVAEIVSSVFAYAARNRASDIHIEPAEEKTRVRFRIDGVLQERLTLPKEIHSSVISRIKILARLKIDEKRVPQDGRIKIKVGEREVDLRVATMPTSLGEKVAIRLLEETAEIPTLQDLGVRGISLKRLEEVMRRPNGIVLVTGPTGSGKTLTLASILSKVNSPRLNIVTIEDPVEVRIPGINQTQINSAAGLTFSKGLRAFLRQDPNIIMVGEVRDSETAELAVHAALTGHLVFSTLHTNSASGALPRLLDMKVEPFLLTSTVAAIEAQRLVRKVCSECKREVEAPEKIASQIKDTLGSLYEKTPKTNKKGKLVLVEGGSKGKECKECSGSGYSGRTGIFEVLMMSATIARLVLEKRPTQEIEKQAVKEGMITLVQDGFMKALEGVTTVEEVLRVAEE
ncbi:MAG TPA: type II/IV secretion system protein [candidate division WWE3 bacterium]|uniref:Type II/IV secretion system protein n=1 Tax=candidate division WWE3 bacterium TaxID=2053526 RepID=A0A7C1NQM7_UNCKA|nr:type II/IV secretion system protein [candidate division WWE3 bacterium]